MGNSISSGDEDETRISSQITDEDEETESFTSTDGKKAIDISLLFRHESLRALASHAKEPVKEDVIQKFRTYIARWVNERLQRQEETVSKEQFVDMLTSKDASEEDAAKAFEQFDTNGEGFADAMTIVDYLQSPGGITANGEIERTIRGLQACMFIPGFIDVYADEISSIGQHGDMILKFLRRNRAESRILPCPLLNGYNNTTKMRLSGLLYIFKNIMESGQMLHDSTILTNGKEVKMMTKCYKQIEVSSNVCDVGKLTDGGATSFWQSDGTAHSHYIRLRMKKDVVIHHMSIKVSSEDQSYMPQEVVISVGKNTNNLREIKEINIPSYAMGEIQLLEKVKTYYPIIQLNFKRCKNDGCDCRIHGLKIAGYKYTKSDHITVLDASSVWFLQMILSTVKASIPLSPALRQSLISQTKNALQHIGPLSLCEAQDGRPQFLSQYLLDELEAFFHEMSIDAENKVNSEGLHVLIGYALASGSFTSILKAMSLLQAVPELVLPCTDLMGRMVKARDAFWEREGSSVALTIVGCDGGNIDAETPVCDILTTRWTSSTQRYISEVDKTKVNMIFKSEDYVQITKLRIKVLSGPRGAKRGLVFVYNDSSEFDLDKHVGRFSRYDTWCDVVFNFSVEARNSGMSVKPDCPVAYFTLDDEWDEVEVPVNWYHTGKYVLVKFLEPRGSSTTQIGVVGVRFFGYRRKIYLDNELDQTVPNPQKRPGMRCDEIFDLMTSFVVDLSRDQQLSTRGSTRSYINMNRIPLDQVWSMYNHCLFKDGMEKRRVLILRLLHTLLQYTSQMADAHEASSGLFFEHLCQLIDGSSVDKESELYTVAMEIIVDGAFLFYPDKEARRKQLFNMINKANRLSDAPSTCLIFQSLCQFFISTDIGGLLDLPFELEKDFNSTKTRSMMASMLSVALDEFTCILDNNDVSDQFIPLIQLIASLQSTLMAWCSHHLTASDHTNNGLIQDVIVAYTQDVVKSAVLAFKLLQGKGSGMLAEVFPKLEVSLLSRVLPELILSLHNTSKQMTPSYCVQLLKILTELNQEMRKMSTMLPEQFPSVNSEYWKTLKTEDVVLRRWDVESAHNYANNQHFVAVYSCHGSSQFIVEFDSRCETERRYDYLEFVDAKGITKRFDQKVGSDKWPKQVVFSGPQLTFTFHSDSSNNEWGYKFKVTAKGSADNAMPWLYDLYLSLAKSCGSLCGVALSSDPVLPRDPLDLADIEEDLLHSELWTTIFRGGYHVTGKKLQRSLSGHFAAEQSTIAQAFLMEMINKTSPAAVRLTERCREAAKGQRLGGVLLNDAITSVFAALLWHTQQLREDVDKFASIPDGDGVITDGIQQAYNLAETLRMALISQKQKLVVEAEDAKADGRLTESEDPAITCKLKATYLMKFAGLTKVQLRQELRRKGSGPKLAVKKLANKKADRPAACRGDDKYPSFRLVMEFIQDLAWSTDKVDQMLKQRSSHASEVQDVYMFAAEYIRIMADKSIFQVPTVVFLQELLSQQHKFFKHYAEGLDGCGLLKEAQVRLSYYTLIRRLVGEFSKVNKTDLLKHEASAYDFCQASLLHLLDTNWRLYDLAFLADIKLPELFLNIAKETVKMSDCSVEEQGEEDELRVYDQSMRWFKDCSPGGFSAWMDRQDGFTDEKKQAVQMFVAKFCDLLDVEISCDGCHATLPGRRYRCLECFDMDLCATCFSGGVKPEVDHIDSHEMVHLVYKCNKCQAFIVGTRMHCNVCTDFDLCLGCHTREHFPSGHTAEHDVTRVSQVRLKTVQDTASLLKAYTHQHVWMLFSSLSLTLVDIMYVERESTQPAVDADLEYLRHANQLHSQCIELTMNCLQQVPEELEEIYYKISIFTGSKQTTPQLDANVFLDFFGEKGSSGERELKKSNNDKMFKKNQEDIFTIRATDLGKLTRVKIRQDSLKEHTSWWLDKVEIEDPKRHLTFTFPCENWMCVSEGDGKINRKLVPTDCSSRTKLDRTPSSAASDASTSSTAPIRTTYLMQMWTSDSRLLEMDTSDYIIIYGEDKDTGRISLKQSTSGETKFTLEAIDVGEIRKIKFASGESPPQWHLETVVIESLSAGKQWTFPYKADLNELVDNEIVLFPHEPDTKTIDKEKKVVLQETDTRSLEVRQQESFAIHSQERIMGLLGAMVPRDNKKSADGQMYNFATQKFLSLLFKMSRGKSGHEANTQHLALGLLGRLLCKSQLKDVDDAIKCAVPAELVTDKPIDGQLTIEYLFSFGATCFERNGLEWACSMSRILRHLYQVEEWRNVFVDHIGECINKLKQKPELSSIFAMFVMAGFPEVLTIGNHVRYTTTGSESKPGVVLKHFPDKNKTLIIESKHRKRYTLCDQDIEAVSQSVDVCNKDHVLVMVDIIKDMSGKVQKDSDITVEGLWMMSLALKLLHKIRQQALGLGQLDILFYQEFIKCLVQVACLGTGFSQQWLLKDLEILSLMLYTQDGSNVPVQKTPGPVVAKETSDTSLVSDVSVDPTNDSDDSDDSDDMFEFDDTSTSDDSDDSSCSPFLEKLDKTTKHVITSLHSRASVPLLVLKALYEASDGQISAVLQSVEQNLSSSEESVIEEMRQYIKDGGQSNPGASIPSMKSVDIGMLSCSANVPEQTPVEKAAPEPSSSSDKLLVSKSDQEDDAAKALKVKSGELLQKELMKHANKADRNYLMLVNKAMVILHARQLLIELFEHWPDSGHVITHELLGCKDVRQIPCVLDLLNKGNGRNSFLKVVENVVSNCEMDSILYLTQTSCQFMDDVSSQKLLHREGGQQGSIYSKSEKISIAGAAYLSVSFDSKCALDNKSHLTFESTDPTPTQLFSSKGGTAWSTFQVPGDSVLYKYTSDESNTLWGFKFTVTPGVVGSFETGYMILKAVLSSSKLAGKLPVSELFSSLVRVACRQTEANRLKTIHLLMRVMVAQKKPSSDHTLAIDLTLLKPLWVLYNAMTEDTDVDKMLPELVRALTGLFVEAESLALDWNITDHYAASLQDNKAFTDAVIEGFLNIASISAMIGGKDGVLAEFPCLSSISIA